MAELMKSQMIIGFPHKPGFGGPGSFQTRLEKELKDLGYGIVYSDSEVNPDVILIVGGTKKIGWLRRCRKKNIPIVYRLDGINWLHKKRGAKQRNLINWLQAEAINLLYRFVHAFLANHIIYQSEFVRLWWDRSGWKKRKNYSIIGNGVDLESFFPVKTNENVSVICLEGTLDYSPYALSLINDLNKDLNDYPFKLYGGFTTLDEKEKLNSSVDYQGKVKRSELPVVYRNTIYISLDINAACPNTVVEALGSGAPVVGYDTGALKELVGEEGGIIVPFGQDAWDISKPSTGELVQAIKKIYENYDEYSKRARALAEEKYSVKHVVKRYIEVLERMVRESDQ